MVGCELAWPGALSICYNDSEASCHDDRHQCHVSCHYHFVITHIQHCHGLKLSLVQWCLINPLKEAY